MLCICTRTGTSGDLFFKAIPIKKTRQRKKISKQESQRHLPTFSQSVRRFITFIWEDKGNEKEIESKWKNIKYKMTDWRKMDRQSPLRELELWEDYLHKDEIFKTKPSSYLRFFHCLVIYVMDPQEPSSFLKSNTVKLVSWFIKKIH